MEQSKYDLAKAFSQIKTSSGAASSFLDVLGADVDSSFTQPMQHAITASTAEISIGGQTLTNGGANLQVQIADEGILLDIHKTCVVYDLTVDNNAWVNNFCAMWRPYQAQIGNITFSVANGDYLLQSYIYSRSKKSFKNSAQGLGLDLKPAPFTPLLTGLSTTITTVGASVASNDIHDFYAGISSFCTKIIGAASTYKCVISIADMFPWLRESFPDGKIALQLGQKLVCNAQLLGQEKWLHQRVLGFAALTFQLKNAVLVKSYTMLDAERQGLILKSTVPLLVYRYLSVQQPLQQSVVLNYALAANEKARRLFISCAFVRDMVRATTDNSRSNVAAEDKPFLADADADSRVAVWKGNSVIANIAKAIQLIQIQFGGQVRTYTMQQNVGLLGYGLGAIESQTLFYADDPIGSSLHAPLVLDLSRFGITDDVFGSSAGNHLAMQVMIQINDGVKIVNSANGTFAIPDATGQYQLQTWLETCSEGSCQQGMYSIKGPLA